MITKIAPELTGGFPRCNQFVNYWLSIKNEGTTNPDGLIELVLDSAINYVSSSLPPDSVIGQKVYWYFDSLHFSNETRIQVEVQMPNFMSIGDNMISELKVKEVINGNIIYTNVDTLAQVLVCAYDPNDKSVTPQGFGAPGYIKNNQELEYLVRFQNTGNDTAIDVMIRDQLSNYLDWNSLEPISSSHNMQVWIEQNGEAVFKFENIMLPDSNVNEIESHGFVKFKINMLPDLELSSSIYNTANIYFDLNPAVVTNTVMNTIYECTALSSLSVEDNLCTEDSIILFVPSIGFDSVQWVLNELDTVIDNQVVLSADSSILLNVKLNANSMNCAIDTLISINVYPNYPLFEMDNRICSGDSILIYGFYETQPGVYYDSSQSINGCDSISITTLFVDATYQSMDTLTICSNDSALLYGVYRNQQGVYYDSLQTISGCDSVLSTTLFINETYLSFDTLSICSGDSILIYGLYETQPGVSYDSLQTINGCDSTLATTLLVVSLPNVTLNSFVTDTLCFNHDQVDLPMGTPFGGSYSGIGVNTDSFDPIVSGVGEFEVLYLYQDLNGCENSDTTKIFVSLCSDINEGFNDLGIKIYPNPNDGFFLIEAPKELSKKFSIKIIDNNSKSIFETKLPIDGYKTLIDIREESNGVYFLILNIDEEKYIKKIIKH